MVRKRVHRPSLMNSDAPYLSRIIGMLNSQGVDSTVHVAESQATATNAGQPSHNDNAQLKAVAARAAKSVMQPRKKPANKNVSDYAMQNSRH